jgi:hypothetical protein
VDVKSQIQEESKPACPPYTSEHPMQTAKPQDKQAHVAQRKEKYYTSTKETYFLKTNNISQRQCFTTTKDVHARAVMSKE